MRSKLERLLASALCLVSCTLGEGEPNRADWINQAGSGSSGMPGSGTGAVGGGGGASGQGAREDGGASGQGAREDGGASGQGAREDGGASGQGAREDGGASGAAGGDAGSSGAGGTGGTTNGLADCTHDGVQSREDHAYYFCSNYTSWEVARDLCAGAGGSLVVIDDAEENAFLTTHFGPHPSWWIGANDQAAQSEWRWVEGGDNDGPSFCSGIPCFPVDDRYVNFDHDQPSAFGDENCGALQSAGTWTDEYCVVVKPFICELASDP